MGEVGVHVGREVERENSKIRDGKRREAFAEFEVRRRVAKAMAYDTTLPAEVRAEGRMRLSQLPRNSSLTRVRNRCVFTGRARGIVSLFRMSRIVFRDLARRGAIHGVSKASW